MRLKIDCSVIQEGKKKFLIQSNRKNSKFKAGTSFSVISDPANEDFVSFQTGGYPNRFHVKKIEFLNMFGVSYEQFRDEKIQKMKKIISEFTSFSSKEKISGSEQVD